VAVDRAPCRAVALTLGDVWGQIAAAARGRTSSSFRRCERGRARSGFRHGLMTGRRRPRAQRGSRSTGCVSGSVSIRPGRITALVVSRLGSWRAALHAAGLSELRPLRIGRRERVATARRLEGKWPTAEIADLLGVTAHGALSLGGGDVRALRRPVDRSAGAVVHGLHPLRGHAPPVPCGGDLGVAALGARNRRATT
jgi:hypothetical protein